jgi:hypothetical protein
MARLSQALGYGAGVDGLASYPLTAATVVPDCGLAEAHIINIGTTTGVAVAAPLNPGQKIRLHMVNASGGASMTVPALASNYLMASNNVCVPPTVAGKQRVYEFGWNGTAYIEIARSLTDI